MVFAVAMRLGMPGAQARGLFNEDGSLRPNGEAYRDFLIRHYRR